MNPIPPVQISEGATGTVTTVFDSVNAKFKSLLQKAFDNLDTKRNGRVTTFAVDAFNSINYNFDEIILTIAGASRSIGVPSSLNDLLVKLNGADMGFWYTNNSNNLVNRGFWTCGDISRTFTPDDEGSPPGDTTLFSPDDVDENSDIPVFEDYLREVAWKLGSSVNPFSTPVPPSTVLKGSSSGQSLPPTFDLLSFGELSDGFTLAGWEGAIAAVNEDGTSLMALKLFASNPLYVEAVTAEALPAYTYVAPGTITLNANQFAPPIDGVDVGNTSSKRFLLKDGSSDLHNGIYSWINTGGHGTQPVARRSDDSNSTVELNGQIVIAKDGDENGRHVFVQLTENPTIGTDNIIYDKFGISAQTTGGSNSVLNADLTEGSPPNAVISWPVGTEPGGTLNARYSWTRMGNLVMCNMRLEYSVAGVGNTTLTISLPIDMPTPETLTGMGANEISTGGGGGLVANFTSSPADSNVYLNVVSGDFVINVISAAQASKGAVIFFFYHTTDV